MSLPEFGVLTAVIIALVSWIKNTFTLTGKAVNIVSMSLGLVFGAAYQLVLVTKGAIMPVEWNGWLTLIINVVVAGIGMGLTASGLYNTDKEIMTKAIVKSVNVNAGDVPANMSHTPPEILEQMSKLIK